MRKPRVSIRWMMRLVLLAALLLSVEQMRGVRNQRLRKADEYRQDERRWQKRLDQLRNARSTPKSGGADAPDDFPYRSMDGQMDFLLADWHTSVVRLRRMADWYERRASHPWETLGKPPEDAATVR